MELPTGTIVDEAYRIRAALSLGKDGDVYVGEPIAPGPPVTIHLLRTALMLGDPGLDVLERAGLELCRFSHDAFPEVVDYGRFMVRPYVVMERIEGRTIASMIRAGELTSDLALRVVNETRKALQTAHKAGMAHGALTAESIIITEDDRIMIPDLYARWLTQQIASKGAPIDPSDDLHALIVLSQTLMKGSRRVTRVDDLQVLAVAPEDVASDLLLPMPLPPLVPPPQLSDFTPEPELELEHAPAPTVMARPTIEVKLPNPVVAKPTLEVKLPEPMKSKLNVKLPEPMVAKPKLEVKLPEPMFAKPKLEVKLPEPMVKPKVALPTPAQSIARPMNPPPKPMVIAQPAIKVRLPPPPMARSSGPVQPMAPPVAMQLAPKPARVAKPRAISELDDPMLSPQLRPGYMGFFDKILPRSNSLARVEGENKAARSFNLLITCAVALVMLAAVLRF